MRGRSFCCVVASRCWILRSRRSASALFLPAKFRGPLIIAYSLLPIAYYLLPIAYCLLPNVIAYCLCLAGCIRRPGCTLPPNAYCLRMHTASECIRPPNAFGRRMHSAADAFGGPPGVAGRPGGSNQARMQSISLLPIAYTGLLPTMAYCLQWILQERNTRLKVHTTF